MKKPSNIKALESGSGIDWDTWVTTLDGLNARELDHTAIAKIALEKILAAGKSKSPEWWAQGVTVAYEQHIDRRQPGQRCDGDFSVTVSRTLDGDMDAALEKWVALAGTVKDFSGVKVSDPGKVSQTEKWRYWRCGLEDGARVSVNFQTKPGGAKSSMAINHDKIADGSLVEPWRAFWKSFTAELK